MYFLSAFKFISVSLFLKPSAKYQLCCETTDIGLVHRVVCLIMPQISQVPSYIACSWYPYSSFYLYMKWLKIVNTTLLLILKYQSDTEISRSMVIGQTSPNFNRICSSTDFLETLLGKRAGKNGCSRRPIAGFFIGVVCNILH